MRAPTDVLLVTPQFHGYDQAIAGALTRRGYHVRIHRYDEANPVERVRHKLTVELPAQLRGAASGELGRRNATERARLALAESEPDVVVVVKGDVLGAAFWHELNSRRIPRLTWLYDELDRLHFDQGLLAEIGPLASYSHRDVAALTQAGVAASYVPLAFDHRLHPQAAAVDPGPLGRTAVLVGARYPAREELLHALQRRGVPVRAYGRDWSSHPLDRLRTWRMRGPGVPAGRDLDRGDAYAVMGSALTALNVHSEGQDGFTMRTFEASGIGGVQLVDRADVEEFLDPGSEVLVGADAEQAAAHCRRLAADPAWAASIRAAGRKRILAEHTFDHRAGQLEALWG